MFHYGCSVVILLWIGAELTNINRKQFQLFAFTSPHSARDPDPETLWLAWLGQQVVFGSLGKG